MEELGLEESGSCVLGGKGSLKFDIRGQCGVDGVWVEKCLRGVWCGRVCLERIWWM